MTDQAKVVLVVRNFISNAYKFTPAGSVAVRIHPEDTTVVIEVRDTGVGIDPQDIPRIFEMFRQVGTSPAGGSGVGLGLYIVKQIVERLRGTIEVDSVPGSGSVFRVRLPGYTAEDVGAADPGASEEDGAAGDAVA